MAISDFRIMISKLMRWLIVDFRQKLDQPLNWVYFRLMSFPWRANWKIYGFPIIYKKQGSTIKIGQKLVLRNTSISNSIGVSQPVIIQTILSTAGIVIGDNVGISGSSIVAAKHIEIGDNVLIGSGALIIDNDLHPIDSWERNNNSENVNCAPVKIGRDVFIGARAMILKGVEIGEGSVIGAGAVVVHDVKPFTIVGGNPAQEIKTIHWKK